jgi:hypothetical protein
MPDKDRLPREMAGANECRASPAGPNYRSKSTMEHASSGDRCTVAREATMSSPYTPDVLIVLGDDDLRGGPINGFLSRSLVIRDGRYAPATAHVIGHPRPCR